MNRLADTKGLRVRWWATWGHPLHSSQNHLLLLTMWPGDNVRHLVPQATQTLHTTPPPSRCGDERSLPGHQVRDGDCTESKPNQGTARSTHCTCSWFSPAAGAMHHCLQAGLLWLFLHLGLLGEVDSWPAGRVESCALLEAAQQPWVCCHRSTPPMLCAWWVVGWTMSH